MNSESRISLHKVYSRNRKEFELRIYSRYVSKSTLVCILSMVNRLEKNILFEISRRNTEWLQKNYESLKKEYDKRWIMIQDRKVVKSASTFDEIMRTVRSHDPNKILVEYIQSEPIAMFF